MQDATDITHLVGGCVYLLYREGTLIYVGKGADIGRPIQSFIEKKADRVEVILTNERDEMERTLIETLHPTLNAVLPRTRTKPGAHIRKLRKPKPTPKVECHEVDFRISENEQLRIRQQIWKFRYKKKIERLQEELRKSKKTIDGVVGVS